MRKRLQATYMACRKPSPYWLRRLIKYICSAARPEAQRRSAACGKPRTSDCLKTKMKAMRIA
jgi:hypothetical protein